MTVQSHRILYGQNSIPSHLSWLSKSHPISRNNLFYCHAAEESMAGFHPAASGWVAGGDARKFDI